MKSVVLLGGYPPPVGGNSVHIERLARELIADGYQCQVVDPYSADPIESNSPKVFRVGGNKILSMIKAINIVRKISPDVVHIHVSAMNKFIYVAPLLLVFLGRRSRIILTVHSGSFVASFNAYHKLKKYFASALFRRLDGLIAVNEEQKSVMLACGCDAERVAVVPAYFPPVAKSTEQLDAILNQAHLDDKSLLVTSGYGLSLYGYEKIIAAVAASKSLSAKCRIVICLYNTYDEGYIESLRESLIPLKDSIILRELKPEEFAYLLKGAALYVRATDRDGDAVAIREANHYAVPVVASSVVDRPDFCICFERSDVNSLISAIESGLSNGGTKKRVDDNQLRKITKLY